MNYTQLTIEVEKQEIKEMIIALLEDIGYEGFEEQDSCVKAYISEDHYDEKQVNELLAAFDINISLQTIAPQNWNAQWESNFRPVVVKDFCTVRAAFHEMEVETPYEIVITPKMSFGTGHHATTQLMMMQMGKFTFQDRTVLDFGTGTGILAILAEQLGSKAVVAIDNDEWSYENTKENMAGNGCSNIRVALGSLEIVDSKYNIILANINRHILLNYMHDMYDILLEGGTIFMSGILNEDRAIIVDAATQAGFSLFAQDELNNWIILAFNK